MSENSGEGGVDLYMKGGCVQVSGGKCKVWREKKAKTASPKSSRVKKGRAWGTLQLLALRGRGGGG